MPLRFRTARTSRFPRRDTPPMRVLNAVAPYSAERTQRNVGFGPRPRRLRREPRHVAVARRPTPCFGPCRSSRLLFRPCSLSVHRQWVGSPAESRISLTHGRVDERSEEHVDLRTAESVVLELHLLDRLDTELVAGILEKADGTERFGEQRLRAFSIRARIAPHS